MTLEKEGQPPLTVNVEYNQIDALLKDSGKEGDVNDPDTGFSPYPGSINQLLLKLSDYVSILSKSDGMMPEFVNPKYADSMKTKFKKPTRLETMMQDYPRLLEPDQKSGFTAFKGMRVFSPVKNSVEGALGKVAAGLPAHSAATGEDNMYAAMCERLLKLGINLQIPTAREKRNWGGITVDGWARISFPPGLATDTSTLATAFPTPHAVSITSRSTMHVQGTGLVVESLELDGLLEVALGKGVHAIVRNLKVENAGSHFSPLDDRATAEVDLLRGYKLVRTDCAGSTCAYSINLQTPGTYIVSNSGVEKVDK
jgi:UDP-sugar pyrophosphorylase